MGNQWYPGAWKVEQGGNGKRITVAVPDNVLHIAASSWNIPADKPLTSDQGIPGWNKTARACTTYNDEYGNMQQYAALDEQVNGTYNGNYRNRTHEAWNQSSGDLNESEYTPSQCERFSDFLAWDHLNNGTKLQDMRNSLRDSHGCGVHRYGIRAYSPYTEMGGEVWSTSGTKLCPGTARVKQLPGILRRAQQIVDQKLGTLPPGRVNLNYALKRGDNQREWDEMASEEQIREIFRGELTNQDVLSLMAQAFLAAPTGIKTEGGKDVTLAGLMAEQNRRLQVIEADRK
jgi:hypothetical protein